MRLRTVAASALIALLAAVISGGLTLTASPASASPQDFTFTSMTADYYLGRDAGGNATLRTVETLVAVFPDFDQNHGIERAVPLKYGEADLHPEIRSVQDGDGRSLPYSRSDSDGFAVLRIGSADRYVHGTMTYRIEYTEQNVIGSFADTASDEFYWDVNGTGWAQPFGTVTAIVHLGDGIESSLTGNSACYYGYSGSTDRCDIVTSGNTFTSTVNDLNPYQTMTIAIGFDPSTFVDPPLLKNNWVFAVLPWILLGITGLAFLFVLSLRIFVWRDARGRGIIIPEYSPPDDAYPMLAAELLQRQGSALPAQIVRFAVARVLAIREYPKQSTNKRYTLELLAGWPAAPESEQWVLHDLFGTLAVGRRMTLDGSDRALGDRLAAHRNNMYQEVRTRGWRARPATRAPRLLGWSTFVTAAAAVTIWIVANVNDVNAPQIWMAALFCSIGWIVVLSLAVPPYLITVKGAEVRDYLLGVRDYIKLAEVDRIRVLQAPGTAERIDVTDQSAIIKLYEKLLPYAMIFGLDKEWIDELGRRYDVTEQPEWYSGGANFGGVVGFNTAIAATSFSTTPPPASSGSSWSSSGGSSSFSGGSSGGGSSGGGGGGGGGGGW